ncbi:hypothetical protein U2F26_27445 [Micromonospora sp. 4G57]|uniref:Uncharacterized protein n=1 Tax=Micromonospora sicca TaxID=2202420 RepID=A0ABU5JI76_9ACTN|nr:MULTISPECIES: hypothetical protein [unclassified Micromonospora]MDZ5446421.1 hypothetical protein [Micromonospora sp. 4G57]MDZ5492337.1 hypothetical protein [Micromonospora sp. 4G53]
MPRERLYRLPAQADPAIAASVLHTAATAYLGLFRTGSLRPGETVVVARGGGRGRECARTACGDGGCSRLCQAAPEDFDWCRRCGAHLLIDYRDQALPALLAQGAPEGFDLWWDNSERHDLDLAVPRCSSGVDGSSRWPGWRPGRCCRWARCAVYTRDASIRGFVISNASAADLAEAAAVINDLLATNRLVSRTTGPTGEQLHTQTREVNRQPFGVRT